MINKIGNVLSLFDGMSCGQIALNRAGILYDNYFASEIDKYAIKVTMANYPNTIQLGSVTDVKASNLPKIDLLIGGSPCQGFSFAGKQLNFDDPRSKLFFEYVRLLKECKPKYFLLENVKMKKEYQDVISKHLGVEPIEINSALVSAQNRKRLYWCNWHVEQPEDKGILLKDIIEKDALPITLTEHRTEEAKKIRREHKNKTGKDFSPRRAKELVKRNDGKSNCLTANLSNKEQCERLQTVPNNFTKVEGISNTQRYKMLGNGWTVDVIAHIFSSMGTKQCKEYYAQLSLFD